ncbi:MAG TPA: glycosyltransferase [Candidatus Acidoferrales bacterium]
MKAIALLGRRDEPTDGVADYCKFLASAFQRHDIELDIVRVPWAERGWLGAMRWLSRESRSWTGHWVILQYTALEWSRRGFSFRVRGILRLLHKRGVRCAVVFHDAYPFEGTRLRDRVRRRIQNWTMRELYLQSERSAFTVPLQSVPWLPPDQRRAAFIPIGANVPSYCQSRTYSTRQTPKIIAVFSVTEAGAGAREVQEIAMAVRGAHDRLGPVRLEIFGRGCEESRALLEKGLNRSGIEIRVRGVIPADEITKTLATAHVLLFVRGLMNSHRGTAIAGIACGLPVVGFGEVGVDPAIESAGIRLARLHDTEALANALVEVLADEKVWRELHERSLRAQAEYFSWDAVAKRFVSLLKEREGRR